jgi:putative hemolysin
MNGKIETMTQLGRVAPSFVRTAVPLLEICEGRYLVRFVRTPEEFDAALRLRFEVFNLELGEGLTSSFQTGHDLDQFDVACDHLIVSETETDKVIGTYRMQTNEMAVAGNGFYTAAEFDLSRLPSDLLAEGIELGRACIAQHKRNTQVLFLLWKGLATYVSFKRKRYLFGCCSLTSQDLNEGWRVMELLRAQGHLHPCLFVPPNPGYECEANELHLVEAENVKLPRLFQTYLRYGAKVCSPPAIDRQFKTIDFLVLFDIAKMSERTVRMFFRA